MRRSYIHSPELTLLRSVALPGAGRGVRASDAERERAAETLRRHHADGRLTTEELEERTERAYASTTIGDLDQLFADLPRVPEDEGERRRPRAWAWPPATAVTIIATLVVVAAVISTHVLWLVWPLLFFVFFRFMRRGHGWRSHGWPEPPSRY